MTGVSSVALVADAVRRAAGDGDHEHLRMRLRAVLAAKQRGDLTRLARAMGVHYQSVKSWDTHGIPSGRRDQLRRVLSGFDDGTPSRRARAARQRQSAEPFSLSLQEALARPLRKWLLDGLVAPGELTLVWGAPKAGKSALVLSVAYQLACGITVIHGHAAQPARILYIAAEGTADFLARLRLMQERFGKGADFRLRYQNTDLSGHHSDDVSALIADLSAYETDVLIIDTFARAMGAADENSSRDMGAFLRTLGRIQEETGVAIIAVHHGRKGGVGGADNLRGHSSLRAAADTVVSVHAGKNGLRIAKIDEARSGPQGDWCAFQLEVHRVGQNDDGQDVFAVVADEAPVAAAKPRSPDTSHIRASDDGQRQDAKPNHQRERDTITAAVMQEGLTPPNGSALPAGTIGANLRAVRQAIGSLFPPAKPDAMKKRIDRTIKDLKATGWLIVEEGICWLPGHATRSD